MKEKPILFSGEMVRAILEGRKTQTRRVIKSDPSLIDVVDGFIIKKDGLNWFRWLPVTYSPYGKPGDRLWVRETWAKTGTDLITYRADNTTVQTAENHEWDRSKWRPSIFMPRWASRIALEIVNVRVERLQDGKFGPGCFEGYKEGVRPEKPGISHIADENGVYWMQDKILFKRLWDSINAKRGYGWDTNPWVWVIEFKPTPPLSD